MRKFEKISFKQFKKDIIDDKNLYESYGLPARKTKYSGGYDLASTIDYKLKPGESVLIPTGLKCVFPEDEILMFVIRSSLGYKHKIRLPNQVGIIDSDYYNNEDNEGHMYVGLENSGTEDFDIKIGDRIAQGIFIKYYTVDDEEEITSERKGGFGSTKGN